MKLVPPLNFSLVSPGVYRSGYPNKKNFPFLKQLKLKSMLYLCEDDYSSETLEFLQENQIQSFHIRLESSKEPFKELSQELITEALLCVLDKRNHPILIHCNKGKHRIGVLVAIIRKCMNWSLSATLDEYRRFLANKIRLDDQEVRLLFTLIFQVY